MEEWVLANAIRTNPGKKKAVIFTRAQVKELLNYFGGGPKNIGIEQQQQHIFWNNLSKHLSLADQFNYTVQEAWKAHHFIICFLRKGNINTKTLAHTSLVRPILDYSASCWHPCKEGQINALDRVQKKAAKFANHTNVSVW